MAQWTHPQCERCWIDANANWEYSEELEVEVMNEVRKPVLIKDTDVRQCSFCGEPTIFGCFVRHDPNKLPFPAAEED